MMMTRSGWLADRDMQDVEVGVEPQYWASYLSEAVNMYQEGLISVR